MIGYDNIDYTVLSLVFFFTSLIGVGFTMAFFAGRERHEAEYTTLSDALDTHELALRAVFRLAPEVKWAAGGSAVPEDIWKDPIPALADFERAARRVEAAPATDRTVIDTMADRVRQGRTSSAGFTRNH